MTEVCVSTWKGVDKSLHDNLQSPEGADTTQTAGSMQHTQYMNNARTTQKTNT